MNTTHFNHTFHAQSAPLSTPAALRQDYLLVKQIGEGSYGKTYLGISRTTQQRVAIKSLKLIDEFQTLEMFKREAMALANIHVRGVPRFIGFVSSGDAMNEYYIIQEYCDFPSLQQHIDKLNHEGKTLDEHTALSIAMQVTNILVAIHMNYSPPIIHRDIKPSNILYDPQTGQVMLIDFGAVANPGKQTQNGAVTGTYGFMAPEQMTGNCSVQSDFYALGMTVLCMITGLSPETSEYDAATSFLIDTKTKLKEKNISQATQKLIQDMTNSQVTNRPATAMELKQRLREILTGESENSKNKLTPKQLKINSNKVIISIFSILTLSIVIWGIFLLYSFMTHDIASIPLKPDDELGFFIGFQNIIVFIVWFAIIKLGKMISKYILDKPHKSQKIKENLPDAGCGENMLISAYAPVNRTYLPDCAECVFYHQGKYYYYYGNVRDGNKVEVRPGVMRNVKDITK